jgi:hypothetical protein
MLILLVVTVINSFVASLASILIILIGNVFYNLFMN